MSVLKVMDLIRKNKSFLITCHLNPEADAIGAELALANLLRKLGKKALVMNDSKVPAECKFLPGQDKIQFFSDIRKKIDCLVFLDCSDSSRAGRVAALAGESRVIINIDHHISNTYFAGANWVLPRASCTCEMIYELYRRIKVPVDKGTALMLYAGIVVDTGSFRFNNTSAAAHEISALLIKKGISPAKVYNALNENNTFKDIKSLGQILSRVKSDPSGRIVWVDITKETLEGKSPASDLGESVLTFLRSIKGIKLAMVFKELRGKRKGLRINLRSQDTFDCNRLAARFGGGGHKNASGVTIFDDVCLDEVKKEIIKYARKLL